MQRTLCSYERTSLQALFSIREQGTLHSTTQNIPTSQAGGGWFCKQRMAETCRTTEGETGSKLLFYRVGARVGQGRACE